MFKNFWTYYQALDSTKKLFWLYLVLIFVEGAMRKWYMTGMSDLWMMCREPIVIWTVFSMIGSYYLRSAVAKSFMAIGLLMFFLTLLFGHHNLYVALFGFRIWFFHIPYIFIIANKLDREDFIRVCQFLTIVFLPMVVLYVLQWASPPNTWINASAAGLMAKGSAAVNGAVRPSGLFAHPKGASYYNPIVVVFFVAATFSTFYRQQLLPFKRGYLLLSTAVMIMLICSVSRGTILQAVLSMAFVAVLLLHTGNPKHILHLVFGAAVIGVLFFVLSSISIKGKNLMAPVTSRFETAAKTEGGTEGIFDIRVLEPYRFWNDKGKLLDPPLFGYGIGAGSNYGTQKLGLGNGKAWGLGEWSSQIVTNEMGFIFGTIVFFLRVGLVLYLFVRCWQCLKRRHDILPMALWTMAMQYFANGDLNLAMTLGWIVILMILLIASIQTSEYIND